MDDEGTYVVYRYFAGLNEGERFYAPSFTHLEEKDPNLMRFIDNIPNRKKAERLCKNGGRVLEIYFNEVILGEILSLSDD